MIHFLISYSVGDEYIALRSGVEYLNEYLGSPAPPPKRRRRKRNSWGVVDDDGENEDSRSIKQAA